MELIRKVTECASVGETLSSKAKWMTKVSMKEEDVRKQLYGVNDPSERKTSSLVPKARVLHAILFNCILPRAGSRHLVTTLDEQCLFYLLNRHPIDLPFLIFHYMVKGMKDTNSYPYGMLLTRIFKESGVLLHRGIRRIVSVKSSIDSDTIRRMGLKNLVKEEADSTKKARTEGERLLKKSPTTSSKSQESMRLPIDEIRNISGRPLIKQASSQKEVSLVRRTDEGALKRKGENLLGEISKKARRSPRIRTLRQQEEKRAREQNQVKVSESRVSKVTRSLVSILQEDSAKQVKETEKKRESESEKQKSQVQKTPRLTEAVKKAKEVSRKKSMSTAVEVSQKKNTVDATQKKKQFEFSLVQDIPIDEQQEEPVELSLVQFTPIGDQQEVTADLSLVQVPLEKSDEPSMIIHNYSEFMRKDKLEVRLIEVVTKRSTAIAICDQPRRKMKAVLQSIPINSETWHLLNEDEKNFYDALRYAATKPYPTKMSTQPYTIYPVTEKSIIKVVPDIQPRYPLDMNKGKKKLYPEGISDDLSADQIEKEVRRIDEACTSTKTSDGAGCSFTDKNEYCPVGGRLITGTFIEYLVQTVMRIRPLSNTLSIQAEAIPLLGRQVFMLPASYDLDLPEPNLSVHPPTIEIVEDYVPSSDAYATTIAFLEPSVENDQLSSPFDSQAEIRHLRTEVKELKEMMNEMKEMMTELLKSRRS